MHRVILDTDIGGDVDDAYALGLLICSPEIQLEAVTVNTGKLAPKVGIARRLLDLGGRTDVPVYAGLPGLHKDREGNQAAWGRGYRSDGVTGDKAVRELVSRVDAAPGEITLVAIGPLTNLAAALELDPDFGRKLRQLILMGGCIAHGLEYGRKIPECNIVSDVPAAKRVFACGANPVVVPLDATAVLRVTASRMAELARAHNPICSALIELTEIWEGDTPILFDPRACSVLLNDELAVGVDMRLEISDDGFTNLAPGVPNCRVVLEPKADLFFRLSWERYCSGPASRQQTPQGTGNRRSGRRRLVRQRRTRDGPAILAKVGSAARPECAVAPVSH